MIDPGFTQRLLCVSQPSYVHHGQNPLPSHWAGHYVLYVHGFHLPCTTISPYYMRWQMQNNTVTQSKPAWDVLRDSLERRQVLFCCTPCRHLILYRYNAGCVLTLRKLHGKQTYFPCTQHGSFGRQRSQIYRRLPYEGLSLLVIHHRPCWPEVHLQEACMEHPFANVIYSLRIYTSRRDI